MKRKPLMGGGLLALAFVLGSPAFPTEAAPGNAVSRGQAPPERVAPKAPPQEVSPSKTSPGPGAAYFPDVVVTDQNGKELRFYSDLIRGNIVIINFMYTHCEGICPRATENLVRVQRALGSRLGREVVMISISLDPERDTPSVLQEYTSLNRVKSGWHFVTGKREDIELLRKKLGVVDPDPEVDKVRSNHTGMVWVGSEPEYRWAAIRSLTEPKYFLTTIDQMKPIKPVDPNAPLRPIQAPQPVAPGIAAALPGRSRLQSRAVSTVRK